MLNEGTTQSARSNALAVPRRLPAWLVALAVGVVALLPRVWGLGDFFTIDEPYHWVGRVQRFAIALQDQRWAATNLTGHPGVTTMWLGALGQWIGHQFDIYYFGWTGGGASYLAVMRLPVALVNSLAVVAGYLLLRHLLRPATAALAALLWATSPFLVAHARLLHLDALVTSFITLSLLLLLKALNTQRPTPNDQLPMTNSPRWALVGSGVFCGLALLTKAPALILLPFAGLLMLLMAGERQVAAPGRWSIVIRRLSLAVPRFALWLGCAALVVVLLWPAMWVAPGAALGAVYKEITQNGGEPHPSGNYFLGQPVADPGALFYPAVILWRTTPVTLVGLLLLVGFTIYDLRLTIDDWKRKKKPSRFNPQSPISNLQSPITNYQSLILPLAAFVLLFTFVMSLEPKKFDRYLLPVWPALEILAAVGWMSIYDVRLTIDDWLRLSPVARRPSPVARRPSRAGVACAALLTLFLAGTLAAYQPYYLAYFNPLLGGGATAQRVMLVGWGEGLDQVGAWLRQRPDVARAPVLSWIPPVLAPFVPKEVLVLDLRAQYLTQRSSYAVLYIRSVQHKESAVAEAAVRATPALFTVQMHGIEYASVHQLARPFATRNDASFGDGLHLRGFTAAQLGSTLVITPSWDIQRDQPAGINTFIHVLDAQGKTVAQADDLIDSGMFAAWQRGQQFDGALHLPNLPLGEYRLVLGVYQAASGARLPIRTGTPLPGAVDGPDALLLTTWKQR